MSSRASTLMAIGGLGLSALLMAACEGSSGTTSKGDAGPKPEAGSTPLPGPGPGGGGGIGGSRPIDAATFEAMGPSMPLPPPKINEAAVKVLPAGAQLLGGITVGCTFGEASRMAGARWCAFSRKGAQLGRSELWVVNMSKLPPKCDGTSPDCLKLSDNLFTGVPEIGPRFPSAHRFSGDTLLYYADAKSAASDPYVGPVYVWQPGMAKGINISGSASTFLCVVNARAPTVICIENLSAGAPLTFDLYAGKFDPAGPAVQKIRMITKILPTNAQTMDSQWGTSFTGDGKYFIYSAVPSTTPTAPETLYYLETDALATGGMPKQVGEPGISNWTVTADYTKWIYMRDYNYSPQSPSGTLYRADFPGGANPAKIAGARVASGNISGVAAFELLATRDAKPAGISLLQGLTQDGRANHRLIKNPAGNLNDDAMNVLDTLKDIPGLPTYSPDQKAARYITKFADLGDDKIAFDHRILKADGTGCTLLEAATGQVFGFPFLENASLTFWVDNYNPVSDTGDGMLASTTGTCGPKRKFSTGVDYWFVKGDEQLLYTDSVRGATSSMKLAKVISGGADLGPETLIQEQIGRTSFGVLPQQEAILFQIDSTSDTANGIYYYKIGATAPTDGGAAEAGAPADAGRGN